MDASRSGSRIGISVSGAKGAAPARLSPRARQYVTQMPPIPHPTRRTQRGRRPLESTNTGSFSEAEAEVGAGVDTDWVVPPSAALVSVAVPAMPSLSVSVVLSVVLSFPAPSHAPETEFVTVPPMSNVQLQLPNLEGEMNARRGDGSHHTFLTSCVFAVPAVFPEELMPGSV
jgi:hypothetical protein